VHLERLIVGDTLSDTVTVPGYPASEGWTLKYRLIPRTSGAAITFGTTPDGDAHVLLVGAATTAAWTAAEYNWAAYVERDTLVAATISAAAADNSFNDSASGFIAAGFEVGDVVTVTGFTGDVANNIASGIITALTAAKMTIGGTDGDVIADDAAGESVTIRAATARSHTVLTGAIRLLADPRVATAPLDLRTDAEIALAAAKAAYAAWTGTTKSYTIGNRSMTFNSQADIIPTIQYWEMQVQREKRAAAMRAGLPDPRKTFVRLGRV
jgi:hypothetical protein